MDHGTNEVWANYQQLSHPDNKYVHIIEERNGVWKCLVKADNKPCWENCLKGLLCSHIIAKIIKTINAGGVVNLQMVGKSCLARHRLAQSEVRVAPPTRLQEPEFDRYTLPTKLSVRENGTILTLMDSVQACASY